MKIREPNWTLITLSWPGQWVLSMRVYHNLSYCYLTVSAWKWICWYFCTLGHLNGSSFFNIHHRNFPIAPFNSELNSAHLWIKTFWVAWKTGRLPTWGKSVKDALSPKGIDKLVFDGECCLFFSTQLTSSVSTGNTIQVVIIWETEVFVM